MRPPGGWPFLADNLESKREIGQAEFHRSWFNMDVNHLVAESAFFIDLATPIESHWESADWLE